MNYIPYKGGKFTKIVFIDGNFRAHGSYEYNHSISYRDNVATMLDMIRNLWVFDCCYCTPYKEATP